MNIKTKIKAIAAAFANVGRMLWENRVVIVKTVSRDLIAGFMLTLGAYICVRLAQWALSIELDEFPALDAYIGITVLYCVLMGISCMLKHKQKNTGQIEKRADMDERVSAQLHELFISLSSILVVSVIFIAGLIYGAAHIFAEYLASGFAHITS